MATGVSLVTKGMITPISELAVYAGGGGGGGLVRKDDDIMFPKIIVTKFKMGEHIDKALTEDKLKVTSVKLIID